MAQGAALRRLAAGLAGNEDELADVVAETARAEIEALDTDPGARAQLQSSVAENIVIAMRFIRGEIPFDQLTAPAAALAYARSLAQRDVPLSALVRAYRLGHAQVLEVAFERLGDLPPDEQVEAVVDLVRGSQRFIDRIVEQVGRAYEVERERWVASRSGIRQQWVNDVLSGAAVDVAEASAALAYPLDARHVCVRLWPAGDLPTADVGAAVAETRKDLARRLRASATLLGPTDEREVRLWLAIPRGTTVRLRPPRSARLHAAWGSPGEGLAGFRRTARQVDRVREVLASSDGGVRWLGYDEVAPVAMLAADPVALADFVHATLGELARTGRREQMLRETLRTFLAGNRSYAAAGAALNLHRNSVQYRVQQALALLPHGLEDELHVRLALESTHLVGESLLSPAGRA